MAEETPREDAIVFDRVSLRFGEKVALRDISFRLERGETRILFGASGSGKSVLLKLTMGLLRPDSGRIFVLGEEVTRLTEEELFPLRHKVGIVFQEGALFDSLTVGENVGYVFERMTEVSAGEAERRVREALRFVDLEQTLELFPSQLSGGMRRRVSIARAIVSQPEIMLYDSPTAGLDPITATRIMTLVIKGRDMSQVSSLLVTHRVQDAFKMALCYYDPGSGNLVPVGHDGGRPPAPVPVKDTRTRFLVLREGEMVFEGPLQALHAQDDPYVRKFLI